MGLCLRSPVRIGERSSLSRNGIPDHDGRAVLSRTVYSDLVPLTVFMHNERLCLHGHSRRLRASLRIPATQGNTRTVFASPVPPCDRGVRSTTPDDLSQPTTT